MSFDLRKSDWGGSLKIGSKAFSIRHTVGIGGVLLWLSILLVRTGGAGLQSMATTAQFLATILLLSAGTLSIGWRQLLSMFLAGGFMMGVLAIVGRVLGFANGGASVNLMVALIEEFAFLLPPFLLLWSWRKWRIWSLGATDIFLLFAACGAGFGMVETAYILSTRGLDQFSWLPVVAMDGDRIRGYHIFNGHEIWASVAGQAIGLAWLLRSKGPLAWLVAAGGIAFGIADHFMLDNKSGDIGLLLLLLFVGGAAAVLLFDAQIIYRNMPKHFWEMMKRPLVSIEGICSLLRLRALAFADYQLSRAASGEKNHLAGVCLSLLDRPVAGAEAAK